MARKDALQRLNDSLLARRNQLRIRLGMELNDMAMSESTTTGDDADAAFDAEGEEMASRMAELESRELAQIERAIERLHEGTFGVCESCKKRIPMMRLEALPYSSLCIECQRVSEKSPWHTGASARAR